AVQRRSNSTSELTSWRTSTRGGSPASTGCSDRIRWAKECSVPMAAVSTSSSAARQRAADAAPASPAASAASASAPSRVRIRSRSSAPAFSVKVMAASSPSSAATDSTSATTRSTSAVVFPDPAPASTNSVVSRSAVIRSRAACSGAGAGAPAPAGRPVPAAAVPAALAPASGIAVTSDDDLHFRLRRPERFGQVGVGSEGGVVAFAVPGPAQIGDAEAVGVAGPAGEPAGRGGCDVGMGGEHAVLDARYHGADHRAGLVQHLVGDEVAVAGEVALLRHEPVVGLDRRVGRLPVEAGGQPVHGQLQLAA